jgi:lipopolysaccharide/colanic/teichoic acid biosynthesis glycosyltransferase
MRNSNKSDASSVVTGALSDERLRQMLRLRTSLSIGILFSVMLPIVVRYITTGISLTQSTQYNTAIGGGVALIIGVLGYRKLHVFPGIAAVGYILMSISIAFGLMVAAFFMIRIEYSRIQFFSSYMIALLIYTIIHIKVAARHRQRLGVVPSASTQSLPRFDKVDWVPLSIQDTKVPNVDAIIVDLHCEHGDDWDVRITQYVLQGIPVYHFKQVLEQISGRVEIYHLSENVLGSLNPNDFYLKIKAVCDAAIALLMLAFLLPILICLAVLVKVDSPGPALFRQQRIGFRGRPFTVYKMRTMRSTVLSAASGSDQGALRQAAMTAEDDPRITRFGRLLRRTRLDELPQLINILRGEMSLIGPRPEALALSKWYEEEIPFYHYRHLIKPGVTGWAQVNQGHVTNVEDVREKLYLDFYYVKNFSFWLDVLIAVRTAWTMVSGRGAR